MWRPLRRTFPNFPRAGLPSNFFSEQGGEFPPLQNQKLTWEKCVIT